ncbi:MAG: CoA-transferase subunit beta [Gammaproteobacteria bacterium]
MNEMTISHCTVGEALIYQIALSVEDGIMAFHGFGSPLVQLALHLAKQTHAPNLVLIAGATYAVNPRPPFLTPTSNDWSMNRGAECHLDIEQLFDLAAAGRLGRMFLSGLQIDRYGNLNVTRLGQTDLKMKLPGGGGGCNLSCDAGHVTLWTAAHRTVPDGKGRRRYRLVEQCDFITSVGHCSAGGASRAEMGYLGKGPDVLITELAVFDFDANGQARLLKLYPDTTVDIVREHTGFDFPVHPDLSEIALPTPDRVEFIRRLDPLKIHQRELKPAESDRVFAIG